MLVTALAVWFWALAGMTAVLVAVVGVQAVVRQLRAVRRLVARTASASAVREAGVGQPAAAGPASRAA